MIIPKILKGFRDYLPQTMIPKKTIINKFENIFKKFGFSPIDTPALEYTEILLGKGGGETDKQIYRFNDHGGRDISLRFDLTVPLARFVAQNYDELVFPFKAYHIAPVWRGENTQKGRYREFYQCDFDILGVESPDADLEILLIIKSGLEELNAGEFRININNRKILNALLNKYNLIEKNNEILRIIDKIYKIGYTNILNEFTQNLKIDKTKSIELLNLLNINESTQKYEILNDEIFIYIEKIKKILGEESNDIINELEYIFKSLKKLNLLSYFALNPAITRGLDYYTGIVFESYILDRINFGSICSGGRYDNLSSLYTKNVIKGVGACFGLDRIISLMEDKNLLDKKSSETDLLILNLESNISTECQVLAEELRRNNIKTEIYLEKKKIQNQFKFAEKKSIEYLLFAGKDEFNCKKYNLKKLSTGEEKKGLTIEEIIKYIVENKKK